MIPGRLRLCRTTADADGLARDLAAGFGHEEGDEVRHLFGLDHLAEWNAGHCLFLELFN